MNPETETSIDNLHIILILDESGSMHNIKSDIIGSVNNFIDTQKKAKVDNTKVTLIKFNSDVTCVYEKKLLVEISELDEKQYQPDKHTALYDAIGSALNKYTDEKACVIIVTDGQDNKSSRFTKPQMVELIDQKKNIGWNFVYLSADLDQMEQAENIGIHSSPNGTVNTMTQNFVCDYDNLGQNIRTRCNTVVTELRTVGHMTGLGTY